MNIQKILIISFCILAVVIICNIITRLDIISTLIGGMVGYFLGKYIENENKNNMNIL